MKTTSIGQDVVKRELPAASRDNVVFRFSFDKIKG